MVSKIGIAGLGAIGGRVARALMAGAVPGSVLAAVAVRDKSKVHAVLGEEGRGIEIVEISELAEVADVVLECLPASLFDEVASPAIEKGRTLVVLSAAALIERSGLVPMAERTGARIIVPSGAILSLDAISAAQEGGISSVRIVTRKPPAGLADAPYVVANGLDLAALAEPLKIFEGTVREAARHFPANVNVAAAVSLAGIGPDRTMIEVWADPSVTRNTQTVSVSSSCSEFSATIENIPSPDNPRTGLLVPLSVLATLRRLKTHLVVGT